MIYTRKPTLYLKDLKKGNTWSQVCGGSWGSRPRRHLSMKEHLLRSSWSAIHEREWDGATSRNEKKEKSQRVRRRQRCIIKGFLFSATDKSGSFWPLKWQDKQPGWLMSADMVTWLPGLMEEYLERQEGKEAQVLWGITTLGRWRMVLIQKRTPFFNWWYYG